MKQHSLVDNLIVPEWSVPPVIQALSTTRHGGVSQAPWNALNLATHVNDNIDDVLKNREILKQSCDLPNEPTWLEQTHSNTIFRLSSKNHQHSFQADATYTTEKNIICCVMTADCLPILLCNKQATWVAAVHAGWKGIANGILKKTVKLYIDEIGGQLSDLRIWFGPAISGNVYQVGRNVKDAFTQQDSVLDKAFKDDGIDAYLLNSVYAAQLQLEQMGLKAEQFCSPDFCTFQESKRFYSYRRDGLNSGRMATMIWLCDK